jgi:nucleotide-binding universal stress UspA family protein
MEVARSAQLLVLGNRTGGWLAGALRGSVSSAAAHEASCPVMLVPHAA